MDNYVIAENFSLLSKLMDIHGDDSFKSRSYSIAAFNIEKIPEPLKSVPRDKLFSIKGIGQSVGKKVIELLDTGKLGTLTEYIERTPRGVIEMMNIKGLGPKKIHTIWKELGIETIGDLEYACNENKIAAIKGFGEKTQKNIQESIEFYLQNQGNFLFAEVDVLYPQLTGFLEKMFPGKVHITGSFRRQDLIIEEMEFIVQETNDKIKPKFKTAQPPELLEEKEDSLLYKLKNGLRLKLYTGTTTLEERLFVTTGTGVFLDAFKKNFPKVTFDKKATTDEGVFKRAGLPYIIPQRRWNGIMIDKSKKKELPAPIETKDIKSIIHSHSNWSDGVNTIEEMATAMVQQGFEYLVISDHSKAAAYANGLTEERIKDQHRYIDELNAKFKPFRIFKSIECDILTDGSLDYSDKILSAFDLVIISVHSNLTMDETKATARLVKALSNPYVTILGHMTGRLLLGRKGYPVNHTTIIDTCAKNKIVIELNAHPKRLDMDYSYIDQALDKGVMISINPDAHSIDEFENIRYGVLAAQKSTLTKKNNLSSYSLNEFESFLKNRRKN